jgi:hypothetical protein
LLYNTKKKGAFNGQYASKKQRDIWEGKGNEKTTEKNLALL